MYASVKTEYGYAEYSNNHTSGRITDYVNKIYYGTDSSGSDYSSYTGYFYTYDNNDNITAEYSKNASGTQTLRYGYVYDSLNQLVRVNDAVAQKTYVYTYDNSGNILTKTEYPYSIGELGTANNTVNYTYDSIWNDKLTAYGNKSIDYDNIGNPTRIGNDILTWSGRELTSYTKNGKVYSYTYDENGLRHHKTVKVNGIVSEQYDYVWSDGKLVSQSYMSSGHTESAKFIYGNDGNVQGFIYNNVVYLYVTNLQNDIVAIVDEQGNEVLKISYDSWGNHSYSLGSLDDSSLLELFKRLSPFTYRGYCYDYDIKMYYLQSRYYDANIGRFINADSTDYLGATGTVLSYNLFSYCENNAVNNSDTTGHWLVRAIVGAASAAIFGGIAYAIGRAIGLRGKPLAVLVAGFTAIGLAIGLWKGVAILHSINKLIKPVIYFFSNPGKVKFGLKLLSIIQFEIHEPHHNKPIHFVVRVFLWTGQKAWEWWFKR